MAWLPLHVLVVVADLLLMRSGVRKTGLSAITSLLYMLLCYKAVCYYLVVCVVSVALCYVRALSPLLIRLGDYINTLCVLSVSCPRIQSCRLELCNGSVFSSQRGQLCLKVGMRCHVE